MSSDCCGWEQVSCNSTTGHIVGLSLNHITDTTNWLLNVSLFRPFKELTSLDLSGNQIGGCIANEESLFNISIFFTFLNIFFSYLLEILDMSGNRFTGSISPYIGALSLTKDILLSDNNFNGAFLLKHNTHPSFNITVSTYHPGKVSHITLNFSDISTIEL
ncbi:hypothetical protein I3842_07G045500 [Carya illinoinensis]|uniref:Leucine-rich repeat-containing N-terminal plant-type domain-containing protein n=1 Tax=Carya illinoinensis TaxID=32201 RepID=A0A922JE78_CARIL|nr:hypothetical protein I3842_07G045500 [Carya illinoinensis]